MITTSTMHLPLNGIRGITFSLLRNEWMAHLRFHGTAYCKRFKTQDEAIQWRKDKELELNFRNADLEVYHR